MHAVGSPAERGCWGRTKNRTGLLNISRSEAVVKQRDHSDISVGGNWGEEKTVPILTARDIIPCEPFAGTRSKEPVIPLTNKRVLVADDDHRLARLRRIHLEAAGAEVLEARDGAAAFRAATLQKPDLVIMDLNMPGTNGFESIRAMRLMQQENPILVLTGYATEENLDAARAAGADRCMSKPPDMDALIQVVAELCGCA
jgi:CheY-like chemotaxis protein